MTSAEGATRVVALISGRGSNLQALIDAARQGNLAADLVAVVSNRPHATGLDRAIKAGIETVIIDHENHPDRDSFDRALMQAIDRFSPRLVVLAGFMRILGKDIIDHYADRMLNIHPSLLPKYRGLHTHQRALEAGDTVHGCSVHFVTNELDGGPVVVQAQVPVLNGDDADALAARVLTQEHLIYPLAVRWFAEGRLRVTGNRVLLDGLPLATPPVFAG
ncbi:MAG: phosphoribosylglycinamide formyltransferase [Proteobacteria bacterium]|nr:MAG: phosphoribosylglycinamide formyltransferase [Pseudomonadota bacterium]